MKLSLRHYSLFASGSKSLNRLVLVLLLSLVGQVWAVPDVCSMMNAPTNAPTKETISGSQDSDASPCHSMNKQSVDSSSTQMLDMGCCDSNLGLTSQHQCNCPDSGCSASFTMAVGFTSTAHIVHEPATHYSTIHFLNRVSTSLYRPPIA